ncbi:MAG: nfuA [Acidimicrobiales bacterium]|jgi:Fe/S biogenesis protein NfuA|nr:nfuA [Acidimicrobiales bacterium]
MDDVDTTAASPTTVLRVTDAALSKITDLIAAEDDPETLGLRVAVSGSNGGDYTYDLSFEAIAEAPEDEAVYTQGALTVMVPADSVEALRGATLDLPTTAGQGGLVIRNPNRPDPLAGITLDLTGSVAEKVTQLLEQQVNPALAAHGGFAALQGVTEDNKVVVTMGGGCQGCAVSAMTLREGIERAILENIPEVTGVIDGTDHDAGENPFYTSDSASSPYA